MLGGIEDPRSVTERQERRRVMQDMLGFLQHSTTMDPQVTVAALTLFDLERSGAPENKRRAFTRLANYFRANDDPTWLMTPKSFEKEERSMALWCFTLS